MSGCICQQYLFPDTTGEAFHPIGKEASGAIPVLQLVRYRLIADDGTCDELGEQGHISAKIDDIFLRFRFTTIDINGMPRLWNGPWRTA